MLNILLIRRSIAAYTKYSYLILNWTLRPVCCVYSNSMPFTLTTKNDSVSRWELDLILTQYWAYFYLELRLDEINR